MSREVNERTIMKAEIRGYHERKDSFRTVIRWAEYVNKHPRLVWIKEVKVEGNKIIKRG